MTARSRDVSHPDLPDRINQALRVTGTRLIQLRQPNGFWEGHLSSSALSTATAVFALKLQQRNTSEHNSDLDELISRGDAWLVAHANSDGGWGDTTASPSNLSTTTLVWSALRAGSAGKTDPRHVATLERAEAWIRQAAGGLEGNQLATEIIARYGKDRTFSVPILTMAALAGCLGPEEHAWQHVIPLPFELAAFPRSWFATLRLPVVSYALPALIAIGLVHHRRQPSRWLPCRWVRNLATRRVLSVLAEIQPSNGGFLEATPLTSFVAMSLIGAGFDHHPVVLKAIEFLRKSARSDGSWPIDTNLAVWVSTLAVNAMGMSPWLKPPHPIPDPTERDLLLSWLLAAQFRHPHSYTQAPPGGWAWTPLPGGVPDADDTSGALIALRHLDPSGSRSSRAAATGLNWLRGLQNRDGGVPTFCRGWGTLPFDRSSPDITAHAVRAWTIWSEDFSPKHKLQIRRSITRALGFLQHSQQSNGSWIPLWFGSHHQKDETNPVYGTSRVVMALSSLNHRVFAQVPVMLRAALNWIASVRNEDGGWGGTQGAPSTLEETSLALEALAAGIIALGVSGEPLENIPSLPYLSPDDLRLQLRPGMGLPADPLHLQAARAGADWLTAKIQGAEDIIPTPIGFYFARLWYFEAAYPLVFSLAALHALKTLIEVLGEDRFIQENEPS